MTAASSRGGERARRQNRQNALTVYGMAPELAGQGWFALMLTGSARMLVPMPGQGKLGRGARGHEDTSAGE